MPFTDEEVDALNAQENAYPLEFFKQFVQEITVYEDD
ncbi:MAG TPA: RluA family pseudouridine synthase, partial [Psychrobacter sp.]|nr:RluA family pseudouridine synthase [Psychrobacter sp.]